MQSHFSQIANAYRDLRTTDIEPILYIKEKLGNPSPLRALDIGCGAGRYDVLLMERLPIQSLTCADANPDMLEEAKRHLAESGFAGFEALVSRVEDLSIKEGSLDCIFTFNAVHHFDFKTFLRKSKAFLTTGGRVFIYTRLPEQNEMSIWGRCFPGFNEKETRLFELEEMERGVGETEGLEVEEIRRFQYQRVSSLERLLAQVREKHYSTFSLYSADDREEAAERFASNVRRDFPDPDNVRWLDGNIMVELRRTPA